MENAVTPDCLEPNPCGPDRLVHIPVESDTDLLVPLDAVEMGIDIPIDSLDKVPLAPVSPWLSVEEESSCITEMNLDDIQLYLECSEDGGNSVSRPISLSDNHNLTDLDGTSFIKSDVQLKISFPKYKEDVKKSKVFKCCCCKHMFAQENQLRDHVSSAHNDEAYLCQVCMYNTKSKKYFQNHMNTKHNIITANNDVEVANIITKSFNCDDATEKVTVYFINVEENSKGNNEYCQNLLSYSNNESEPGTSGSERTESSGELVDTNENNKMSITHENNLPCFTVTEENQNLILRPVTEENQNLKPVTEENQILDLQHTNTDGDNETYSDNSNVEPTTETVVGSTLELPQHEMRTVANNVSQENAGNEESDRIKCDICGFITSSIKLLKYHQMNMHNDFREKYTCDVCQFECLQKRTFERHKKIHIGKLDFKCSVCDKSFYTQASYDRHLKTHNKLRNYQCEYPKCGKSFKTKGHLTDHVRKVHERKKYWLPKSSIDQSMHADSVKCESTSSDHSKSKRENRPLVEIEKFTSDLCNSYQQNDADSRGAHSTKSTQTLLFINTENKKAPASQSNITNKMKKFACNFKGCNKTFRDNFNLQNHICTHDKTKLLHCDMCDFTCIQKTSLNYHCKTKH